MYEPFSCSRTAFLWHTAAHAPHPMQASCRTAQIHPGIMRIAPTGHRPMQAPQPTQTVWSIYAVYIFISPYAALPYKRSPKTKTCLQARRRIILMQLKVSPRTVIFPLVYNTFLLSAPGVVTITCSVEIIKAPLAVAAPLNIASTMFLNVSTTGPSVTYSATPLI